MAELRDGQHARPTGDAQAHAGQGAAADDVRSILADPHALRLDVTSAMGVEAGPWTIAPTDDSGVDVRWLDAGRARVRRRAGEDPADDPVADPPVDRVTDAPPEDVPVVLGLPGTPDRAGRVRREIVVGGWRVLLDVEPERTARLRERARRGREDAGASGPLEVRAVIPGRIVAVSVVEGDTVEAGQQLLVVEAMKMQNEIRAPHAGTVQVVAVSVGQNVELGALLVALT